MEEVAEYDYPKGKFILGGCLEKMQGIPDNSIDMILCDLPYGTTACKWDSIIPFDKLWFEYLRICKGAIALTASQPFNSALIMSNPTCFKHEWIWKKDKSGNIATLKYQPAKIHESVLIFGNKRINYNPIMEKRDEKNKRNNAPRLNKVGVQGNKEFFVENSKGNLDIKYPTSVKEFNSVRGGFHPTQKPVALFEYLIKTYTNKGDTVLDNCAGSGTTAIAAINTRRNWICIEKEKEYFDLAVNRIDQHIERLQNV